MYQIQPQIRINNPQTLPYAQIEDALAAGQHVILQFVDPCYTDSLLRDINRLCAKYGKNFGVRFYGHYTGLFDCAIVSKIPDVKCLYVDCLMKAENVHQLKELRNLQKLGLGIYDLKDTEILDAPHFKKIEDLIVTETKTKALNLASLKDYKNLKSLFISGHTKNIDVLGELSELESLSLHATKKVSVSFVNKLRKLRMLNFILGGREDINEIGENQIEHLEILRVRGFRDLGNMGRFLKLKTLIIEDQIQLKDVNFDQRMPYLEDLKILNCKTLEKIEGLANLPHLHQLKVYRTAVEFAEFITQKLPVSLKILAFYTGKSKVDSDIKRKLEELGYLLN